MIYTVNTPYSKEVHLRCDCGAPDHVLVLTVYEEDDYIYAHYTLADYIPWYKRIVLGIKYIFGVYANQCMYVESVLKLEELKQAVKELEEVIDENTPEGTKT